jgi:hypothetical protein
MPSGVLGWIRKGVRHGVFETVPAATDIEYREKSWWRKFDCSEDQLRVP